MSDTKKSSLSVEVFRDGKFVEVDPKTVLRNDHNALEALIASYRVKIHSGDTTHFEHLISAARKDRERLVEELSASVKTVLKYKELLDKSMHNAQEAIELNNKLLAALDPKRKP